MADFFNRIFRLPPVVALWIHLSAAAVHSASDVLCSLLLKMTAARLAYDFVRFIYRPLEHKKSPGRGFYRVREIGLRSGLRRQNLWADTPGLSAPELFL